VLTKHLVQPVFIATAKPAFDKLTPAQQTELRAAHARPPTADHQDPADEKSARCVPQARISERCHGVPHRRLKEYAGRHGRWKPA
jgi:hypothetical protein